MPFDGLWDAAGIGDRWLSCGGLSWWLDVGGGARARRSRTIILLSGTRYVGHVWLITHTMSGCRRWLLTSTRIHRGQVGVTASSRAAERDGDYLPHANKVRDRNSYCKQPQTPHAPPPALSHPAYVKFYKALLHDFDLSRIDWNKKGRYHSTPFVLVELAISSRDPWIGRKSPSPTHPFCLTHLQNSGGGMGPFGCKHFDPRN